MANATGAAGSTWRFDAPTHWFPASGWTPAPPPLGRPVLYRKLLAGGAAPLHVLMIEDDPSIADMYRLQLEHDGYRVTNATTGEVAFTSISDDAPDLVLLDLLLPDRSGFEVLSALNDRLPNHPPVVILSNYGEPEMIDRGRSLGAIEYLVKSRVTPADISRQIPIWVAQGRGGEHTDS
ncbi:MAG TPA: response regulator [Candidatus Dormibacteraeota bacterium]|nr:response regulator [Candidatus Dormibacteraeota bacterium]